MESIFFIVIELFIFIGFPIILASSKDRGAGYILKKIGRVLLYVITVTCLVIMVVPVLSQITDFETTDNSKADGFTIDYYKVVLDVNESQKVDVEEDIGINFFEEGHHGIYKFTPEWLKYTSKSGKTIRRKSVISDLRSEDPTGMNDETYDYETDVVNKKQRIKIGSYYETLGIGLKDYIIKYNYDMGSDPYEGYDEFIFHAYGDFWGTEIKNPSIEVNMPKSIEGMKVRFFMDKFRKKEVTDYVDYSISGNKLIAKFNNSKYQNNRKTGYPKTLSKSLTVDIELPDNYFDNGSFNYGYKSLTCIIISLILMGTLFLLWLIFGKDYDKKAKVVSYMPPRDLSAAELGYISSNMYSKKLVVSLIVELAAKKMITIREKDGRIYIKGDKPSSTSKDYQKLIKKYDKKVSELNPYEQIVINELIKGSSEIKLSSHETFYKVFSEIENKLDNEYRWVINEKVSYVLKYLGLFFVNIAAISMFLAYRTFEDLPQKLYSLYYVGFISVFISCFLSVIMTRKSRYGEDITVEVSGFKEFLDKVEKDKLEELVEEMPDYFYQILPYTYVLNLSKKWIEKFEDIKIPDKEFKDIDLTVFDDISDQVYIPMPTSSGSSSGCSSCGGGCSSCGGGCSSCGGGGSW